MQIFLTFENYALISKTIRHKYYIDYLSWIIREAQNNLEKVAIIERLHIHKIFKISTNIFTQLWLGGGYQVFSTKDFSRKPGLSFNKVLNHFLKWNYIQGKFPKKNSTFCFAGSWADYTVIYPWDSESSLWPQMTQVWQNSVPAKARASESGVEAAFTRNQGAIKAPGFV